MGLYQVFAHKLIKNSCPKAQNLSRVDKLLIAFECFQLLKTGASYKSRISPILIHTVTMLTTKSNLIKW